MRHRLTARYQSASLWISTGGPVPENTANSSASLLLSPIATATEGETPLIEYADILAGAGGVSAVPLSTHDDSVAKPRFFVAVNSTLATFW
jgi:hypothetical protein